MCLKQVEVKNSHFWASASEREEHPKCWQVKSAKFLPHDAVLCPSVRLSVRHKSVFY